MGPGGEKYWGGMKNRHPCQEVKQNAEFVMTGTQDQFLSSKVPETRSLCLIDEFMSTRELRQVVEFQGRGVDVHDAEPVVDGQDANQADPLPAPGLHHAHALVLPQYEHLHQANFCGS